MGMSVIELSRDGSGRCITINFRISIVKSIREMAYRFQSWNYVRKTMHQPAM